MEKTYMEVPTMKWQLLFLEVICMKVDAKTGKLVIHQVDVDHIIGWFTDGDSLEEAIERELYLHGLEGKWEFDADKIIFDND